MFSYQMVMIKSERNQFFAASGRDCRFFFIRLTY